MSQSTAGDLEEEEEEEGDELVHGRRKRKVAFMPSLGTFPDFRCIEFPDGLRPYLSRTENSFICTPIHRHNTHHLLPWPLVAGPYHDLAAMRNK